MKKQVILVRKDLRLPKGKLAVQVAHASVEAVLRSNKNVVEEWRMQGAPKIVLKVKNLDELLYYKNIAEKNKLVNAIISDAGKTVVEPGTTTCLAIGPDDEEKIDPLTSSLSLL